MFMKKLLWNSCIIQLIINIIIVNKGLTFSFDTQGIIESIIYPPVNKNNIEAARNISLTLSAYKYYCLSCGIDPSDTFEKQIKEGKTKINLNGLGLTFKDIEPIAYSLAGNKTVNYLNLSDNYLGNPGAVFISGILKENLTIKTIDLKRCYTGDAGIKALGENISNSDRKINLDFPGEKEGNLIIYLDACYKYSYNPEKRIINYFRVDSKTMRLPYINDIQPVFNAENNLTDTNDEKKNDITNDLIVFSDVLKYSGTLKTILILDNLPDIKETRDFFSVLKERLSVTNLVIKNNAFTQSNAEALFEALQNNQCITSLTIDSCGLDDNEMKALTIMLNTNQTIENFSFVNNLVTPESSLNLIKTLYYNNNSIKYLELKGLVINDEKYLTLLKKKFPEREASHIN